MWLYGFVQSIFSVGFDDNCHHLTASCTMHTWLNRNYGSAYTGMYRCADKSGSFSDLLSNLYRIAYFHDRVGRCTKMLGHGDHNSLRIREFLQIDMLAEFLVL